MQNDGLSDRLGYDGACAGFMAIRSTAATRQIFTVDPQTLTAGWDDQKYLNALLTSESARFGILPLKLFPNGQYFARHCEDLVGSRVGPYLVHFNWVVGGAKRNSMENAAMWFVGNAFDTSANRGR